jgi:hypothetical protein
LQRKEGAEMKKSTILRSVLLGVLCALVIEHVVALVAIPLPFRPNWLTIIPAIAVWAAFVGIIIRRELEVAEPGKRKAKAGLAIAWTAFGERSGPAVRLS